MLDIQPRLSMSKMKTFSIKSSPATSTSKPSNESEHSGEQMVSTVFGCLSVNARTNYYRRFYLFQMICFPFIPILALFVQNLTIFIEQLNAFEETRSVNEQVGSKLFPPVFFLMFEPFLTDFPDGTWFSSRWWTELLVFPFRHSTGECLKASKCNPTRTVVCDFLSTHPR